MGVSMLLLVVPASFSGFICFLFFVLPLILLIGSVFLIAAIGLLNKVVGHDRKRSESIPVPSVPEAMGILLVAMILNFVISFALGFFMGVGGINPDEFDLTDKAAFQLTAFGLSLLVNSTVFSLMLPTTFFRAMGIVFFQNLIILANVIMIAMVVVSIIYVFKGM